MTPIDQIKSKIATFLEFNKEIPKKLLKEYNRLRLGIYDAKHCRVQHKDEPDNFEMPKNRKITVDCNEMFKPRFKTFTSGGIVGDPKPKESEDKRLERLTKLVEALTKYNLIVENTIKFIDSLKKQSEPIQKEIITPKECQNLFNPLINSLISNYKIEISSIEDIKKLIEINNEINGEEIDPKENDLDYVSLIRDGKWAIENNVSRHTLKHCLNYYFPEDFSEVSGDYKYYFKHPGDNKDWDCSDETNLPSIKATDLIKIIESKK